VSLATVLADGDMDMDGDRIEFHPINAGSKLFHWILTLAILFLLPCVSVCFALANKIHWSLLLQFVATAYSVIESLFLPFPDNVDNHENRTSSGTSWFLSILLGVTVFMGSFINGSNLIMTKYYPKLTPNEYGWSYKIYKILSCMVALTGWIRTCLAVVALFGFCYHIHTGQCIAHGIMGTAFIGYSFILSLVLVVPWIRKHQLQNSGNFTCQEFYDSAVICVWGIVNTFTEHRWGKEDWNMGDYQHTAMGIIWWCGGLLGMWLARNNNRTFVPALILIFTGYSMSEHSQHMVISTKVHGVFGFSLMAAGVSRIIEISFLLKDRACSESGKILSFQHFPSFCLTLAGTLFMSANEEQLVLVHDLGSDHSAYILVVSSAAFMIYLWFQLLLWFYLRLVGYDQDGELSTGYQHIGARDIEQFELGELSEDEDNNELAM
jgi:hypothetical protein